MRCLSKNEFLSADDLPIKEFALPEVYGEDAGFFLRTMTGTERSEIEKLHFSLGSAQENPAKFRAAILISCVVDASGDRVFSATDEGMLMAKSAGTLEEIFTAACELNGFMKDDVEALEKN